MPIEFISKTRSSAIALQTIGPLQLRPVSVTTFKYSEKATKTPIKTSQPQLIAKTSSLLPIPLIFRGDALQKKCKILRRKLKFRGTPHAIYR